MDESAVENPTPGETIFGDIPSPTEGGNPGNLFACLIYQHTIITMNLKLE